MKECKLVLTGFEPFGGSDINPSEIIAKKFDGFSINNGKTKLNIIGKIIPLIYSKINKVIENIIDGENPDYLVMLGQASRSAINIERIAINVVSVEKVQYNCGSTPFEECVIKDGPVSYFSTTDIIKIRNLLINQKIPAKISNTAGTFGCNQIFYSAMHKLHKREEEGGKKSYGLFIHIPMIPEQVKSMQNFPSMEIKTLEKAVTIILTEYFLNE